MVSGVELLEETGLGETELKGGELGRQKVDDLDDIWWWDQKGVDTVNDTVGTEDVDSDNAAVEVEGETLEIDLDSKSLWLRLVRKVLALEKSRNSVSDEDSSGWVELWRDVVRKDGLRRGQQMRALYR